jgi:hypothetical protein
MLRQNLHQIPRLPHKKCVVGLIKIFKYMTKFMTSILIIKNNND